MDIIASLVAHPDFSIFSDFIKGGTINERKHVILLARHQSLPVGFGDMYNIWCEADD
jgi:hypothetical protein